MKIIKTAKGNKIKISKKEWQNIGKTAGWIKVSGLPSQQPNQQIDMVGQVNQIISNIDYDYQNRSSGRHDASAEQYLNEQAQAMEAEFYRELSPLQQNGLRVNKRPSQWGYAEYDLTFPDGHTMEIMIQQKDRGGDYTNSMSIFET